MTGEGGAEDIRVFSSLAYLIKTPSGYVGYRGALGSTYRYYCLFYSPNSSQEAPLRNQTSVDLGIPSSAALTFNNELDVSTVEGRISARLTATYTDATNGSEVTKKYDACLRELTTN